MSTDLRDALHDLAGPTPDAPAPGALWQRGTRRRRVRLGSTTLAVAAVLGATIVAITAATGDRSPVTIDPIAPSAAPSPVPDVAPAKDVAFATVVDGGRVLVRPDGTRQDLEGEDPRFGVVLGDGTYVYEADGSAPVGSGAILAVRGDGTTFELAPGTPDATGQHRLLGTATPGGTREALLVRRTVDGFRLQAWDDDTVTDLGAVPWWWATDPTLRASVTGPLVAVAAPGDLPTVSLGRLDALDDWSEVAAAEEGVVVGVVHAPDQLAVLVRHVHGSVAKGEVAAEVVVLDPEHGTEVARHEVPSTSPRRDASPVAVHLAAWDQHVVVHLEEADGDALPSAVLDLGEGTWTAAPTPGHAHPVPLAVPDATAAECEGSEPDTAYAVFLPCGRSVSTEGYGATMPLPHGMKAMRLPPADRVEALLRAVFAGPTPQQAEAGHVAIVQEDPLASVTLDGTTAVVDLDSDRLTSFSGGATLAAARFHSAVVRTATQVDGVDAVRITVDGSCDAWATRNEAAGCQTFTVDDVA